MKKVETNLAPAPAGHYSQAIIANGFIFVSGQLGKDPNDLNKPVGTIEEQTHQTIKNVRAVLTAAGVGMENVVKSTVYISDISLWGQVNKIYALYFGDHMPARAIVPTRELHYGFQIEMEVIAVQ